MKRIIPNKLPNLPNKPVNLRNIRFKSVNLPKKFSLREFWEARNQVLIMRDVHAIGDLFIHRMIFEDIKKLNPELQIHFAISYELAEAMKDHPYIDKLLDWQTVKSEEYLCYYNTSSICVTYEDKEGPNAYVHRSDLWAGQCGLTLQSHNMHIHISSESQKWANEQISELKSENKPIVLLAPYSANSDKDMLDDHIRTLAKYLTEKGCVIFSINKTSSPVLDELNIPVFTNVPYQNFAALVNVADYIISTDTAFYHIAGGLKKPLVGFFGYINGKVYGKYYESEFIQKHRDNGDWDCGPCGYHFHFCPKPKINNKFACIREISPQMLKDGIDKMFKHWPWEKAKDTILKEQNGNHTTCTTSSDSC